MDRKLLRPLRKTDFRTCCGVCANKFPVVIVPVAMQHYMLLQRNLIHTAITRGKKMVVLIGQKKALGLAIRNNRTGERFSGLLERLRGDS